MYTTNNRVLKQQRGATLIVSLVILAVVTILGLASIRSSNLELTMAASARDRAVAFQRAEAALKQVEQKLSADPPPFEMQHFSPNCNGAKCFKSDCANGQCFAGDFDGAVSKKQCRLAPYGASATQHWRIEDVWDKPAKHKTLNVGATNEDATADPVKYIIEFMCFVPRGDRVISSGSQDGETDVPLYRLTVQAKGEAARSTVMLQSTFRAAK